MICNLRLRSKLLRSRTCGRTSKQLLGHNRTRGTPRNAEMPRHFATHNRATCSTSQCSTSNHAALPRIIREDRIKKMLGLRRPTHVNNQGRLSARRRSDTTAARLAEVGRRWYGIERLTYFPNVSDQKRSQVKKKKQRGCKPWYSQPRPDPIKAKDHFRTPRAAI